MNGFIEIITGTLGGGKTALGMERAYDHLFAGGWVYTNIEVCYDFIEAKMAESGRAFERDRLVMLSGSARQFHTQIQRGTADRLVMLVVDEAGLEINARDWAKTEKDLLAFCTMARKLDVWLVYISQDVNDVDKQIRKKADTVWVCRNMKKVKIWGIIPFPLPFYFRVRFDNTLGGKPKKMDAEVVLRPRSWGMYNSDAMVGETAAQFRGMQAAISTPLKRIPKTVKPETVSENWLHAEILAALVCVISVYF